MPPRGQDAGCGTRPRLDGIYAATVSTSPAPRRRVSGSRVHIAHQVGERYAGVAGIDDPFDTYPPPFDLTSDMLLAGATCAAEPVARAFPGLPVRTFRGSAVLGIWFSRVEEIRAGPEGGMRIGPGEALGDVPYQELNVAVLLRDRRLFVPGIYATSELTLRLGHRYGMPKERAEMTYEARGARVTSRTAVGGDESHVEARSLPLGHLAGVIAQRALPWWSWPVEFPSGSRIEGYIEGAAGARAAWLYRRRLALNEPWLPQPAHVWPLALRIPAQVMRLPAP